MLRLAQAQTAVEDAQKKLVWAQANLAIAQSQMNDAQQRLIQERITGQTIRVTLERMGVKWAQAKHWAARPEPEHNHKKSFETG